MADYENNENMNENENAENESGSNTIADAIGNIGAKVATAALTFGGIYVTKKLLDKAFSGKKPEENASQATGEKVSLREKWARRKDAKAAERLRKRGHDVKTVTEQEETNPEQDEE